VISAGHLPYLLHPYSNKRVISTDARMDPVRPTRFEKKKNMLPNVPGLSQFHVIDLRRKPIAPPDCLACARHLDLDHPARII
jgi:hypothetical protein